MEKELTTKPTGTELQVKTTQEVVHSAFSSKSLTKEQMNILRTQIAPDIADNDLMYCLEVADKCGLNPILKDIYFVPRMANVNGRWVTKHEPMVGRKGARSIARRKGMKIPPNTGHSIKKYPKLINNEWVEERDLVGWAELIIDGQTVRKEAAYSTYKQTKKDGTVTKFWQDMPTVMVEKVAEFQLLDAVYGLDGVMSIDAGYVSDNMESASFLSDENEKALQQLGIKLQKFNGVAIASNFQGKEKYLEDFGFIKNGGNWSIEYVEKPSQIQAPKNVEPKKENKEPISPAAKLFSYLNKKQLDKEQIKVFVNDVLGLTKEDTEGINEVLADLASLDIMVDEFLSNFNVPMEKEGLETGSLF